MVVTRWPSRWNAFPELSLLTSRPARVLWHLFAFAAGWVLIQGVVESAAGPVFAWLSGVVGEPVPMYPYSMLAGVIGGSWVGFRAFELAPERGVPSRTLSERLGVDGAHWRLRPLLTGVLLGSAAIGLTAGVLWATGLLRFETATPLTDVMVGDSWGSVALRLLVVLAPAALWEELAFRGFLYAVAEEAAGPLVARWASSVAFGMVHVLNPGASVQTTLIVMLAGWCLARLREQAGVPAAWLAHLAWNWIMAAVLHVAVSGLPFATPGYRAVLVGPDWLSGGSWGPEGGVIAALVLGGGALLARTRPEGAAHELAEAKESHHLRS